MGECYYPEWAAKQMENLTTQLNDQNRFIILLAHAINDRLGGIGTHTTPAYLLEHIAEICDELVAARKALHEALKAAGAL